MDELFEITFYDSKPKHLLFSKVLDKETKKEYDDYLFRKGEVFNIKSELTRGKSWGKNFTDFHIGIGGSLNVNEKFISCLNAVGETNFQLIPVTILPEEKKYHILNVLNIIDCVDRENSKFKLWTEADNRPDRLGGFRTIDKLVLDRSTLPSNIHLFRIKGWVVATIVTKELAEEFKKNNIKGFNLRPVG